MNKPLVLTQKDLDYITTIALRLFHEKPIFHRTFILFEALETYLKNKGIEPGFKVEYDSSKR